jgi:WD40 repeat protein
LTGTRNSQVFQKDEVQPSKISAVQGPTKQDTEEQHTNGSDEDGPELPHDDATSENVDDAHEPVYDDGYDPEEDLPAFPITHEVVLKDHTKVISAIGLDPSGARMVSGSYDYDLKLWDFGGMDSSCKPFKSWEPVESYNVRCSPCSVILHPGLIGPL